jgi:anti-sigma factor RsiW
MGFFSPMDCRAFRNKHVAFVDDFLPGEDVVVMQRHLLECERCAAHDAKIRRSLLLFRNLPVVEASPDFYSRLSARIASEHTSPRPRMFAARGPGIGTFVGVAASLVTMGYVAATSLNWTVPRGDLALAPVVATEPAVPSPFVENQALVASVSAGMPVWPMVYFAEQAPMRFAQVQFTQAIWKR